MNNMTCPSCGSPMKRNGKTKSGSQRWRCVGCGASATHFIDTAARDLAAFVGWLLSKDSQVDMPGKGRTLRRRCVFRQVLVDKFCVLVLTQSAKMPAAASTPPSRRPSRA